MLKLTYIGHSAFILNDGKYTVVIDPFITGNPAATITPEEIDPDFVVVTHAHGDHLGDGIELARRKDVTFIAVNELANYAAQQGATAHNMHIGGAKDFPFGRLKFTIAHHGSALADGSYMGSPAGVVIQMGGKTIYHTGDTGVFLDMKLIGEIDKIDIMLAPIGDNFTMGVDDAVRAVKYVDADLAIPMHYNTWPVIAADPEEFRRKIQIIGKKAEIMQPGQVLEFE